MTLIWVAGGRTWGFRFLLAGGSPAPFRAHREAFAGLQGEPTAFRRTTRGVALRFPDPAGRRDEAARPLAHEFVVASPVADDVRSAADGIRVVWPLVADAYASLWDLPAPPTQHQIALAFGDDPHGLVAAAGAPGPPRGP